MTLSFRSRRVALAAIMSASVAVVLVAALLGAPAAGAAPPPPFPLPMDAGTRAVEQEASARDALLHTQPEVDRAEETQRQLQGRLSDLEAQVAALQGREQAAAAQLVQARRRIAAVAAEQYVHASGERVNAAIEAALNANDLLSLGRNLHILEASGSHELDVFAEVEAQHEAIEKQLDDAIERRDSVKDDLAGATRRVDTLDAALARAGRDLADAQEGITRFQQAATTAASPIMGPSRLTAADLAAFVRVNGGTPNITVPLEELAQAYIDEGQKVGVRGDVAFAQSIVETGFFGFRNSMVEPTDNNFAGIGACDSCTRGFSFPTAQLGVRAQMQLLRVYVDRRVSADSLPDPLLLPGTLRLGFRGRVQSWWDLTGRWATAPDYGNVVYDVYNRIVAASGR
jgi:hypothetical protein